MNREHLDTIIRDSLYAYANSLLVEIGSEFATPSPLPKYVIGRIKEREYALSLLTDDAARLKIVEDVLKEMK